jgi:predicted RNase H-like HicB family nuclease
MPYYVAIVEDAGPETAIGIWFPDLPGCFSAGDDVDDALRNAEEAITLYAEGLAEGGRAMPSPRSLVALRDDPEIAPDLQQYMVVLVPYPARQVHAAE